MISFYYNGITDFWSPGICRKKQDTGNIISDLLRIQHLTCGV